MKSIVITLQGISPLLMHRFPLEPVEAIEKKSPEEQAEIAAYRDPDGQLFVPAVSVQRALVSAANYSKGKGRGSLARQAAACLFVGPARLLLGTDRYEMDAQAVVIPATKGRIVRYRPRLDKWEITFELEYDELLLKEGEVRKIVDDMGSRVGLLDFRPEKKGPFGRSKVIHWNA